MSIKLSVYPWCGNCPRFSPNVDAQKIYDGDDNPKICDTYITCKNESHCLLIKKYLERQMKGEKKND